ncbi:hypothetical protein BIW11_04031 [Tropilaelaps mercedesae]|uniref:Uncharacterized protein n=1 Tax=Tropilaelaps mercedesae TaxID=418985 RepID=A0A1V9XCG7_9ACAR|nr:hypothetical protein BIW11_04031 [Tropilaelaps mercedesae]
MSVQKHPYSFLRSCGPPLLKGIASKWLCSWLAAVREQPTTPTAPRWVAPSKTLSPPPSLGRFPGVSAAPQAVLVSSCWQAFGCHSLPRVYPSYPLPRTTTSRGAAVRLVGSAQNIQPRLVESHRPINVNKSPRPGECFASAFTTRITIGVSTGEIGDDVKVFPVAEWSDQSSKAREDLQVVLVATEEKLTWHKQ